MEAKQRAQADDGASSSLEQPKDGSSVKTAPNLALPTSPLTGSPYLNQRVERPQPNVHSSAPEKAAPSPVLSEKLSDAQGAQCAQDKDNGRQAARPATSQLQHSANDSENFASVAKMESPSRPEPPSSPQVSSPRRRRHRHHHTSGEHHHHHHHRNISSDDT